MGTLSLENLSMRFELPNGDSVQALENVSPTLQKGELLSILGPSGCGKTTLLNIVAGFLSPTEGRLVLNGHDIVGSDAERGMVFQQGALFEWMSVRENVGFGPMMKGTAGESCSFKELSEWAGELMASASKVTELIGGKAPSLGYLRDR